MGTAYAMLADVIDYGEWKNGVRNEGLTFAGGTFATTVGTGLTSGGVLLLILFYFYNLDTFYKDIVRDIKNRA